MNKRGHATQPRTSTISLAHNVSLSNISLLVQEYAYRADRIDSTHALSLRHTPNTRGCTQRGHRWRYALVKVSSVSLSRRRFITQADFVFALFGRNSSTKFGPGQMSVQKSKFANSTEQSIWADPKDPDYGNLYHIIAAE